MTDWERLAKRFEALGMKCDGDAKWVFEDSSEGTREHWWISAAGNFNIWGLLAEAGRGLPAEEDSRAKRALFPRRLLAEASPEKRWLAALRHGGVNVIRLQPRTLRNDNGMIYAVAAASAALCRRLAAKGKGSRVTRSEAGERESGQPPSTGTLLALLEIHVVERLCVQVAILHAAQAWRTVVESASFTFDQASATYEDARSSAETFLAHHFPDHKCDQCVHLEGWPTLKTCRITYLFQLGFGEFFKGDERGAVN